MAQQFILTNFPVPTAGKGTFPELHHSNGHLLLSFKDQMDNDVRVRFHDVLGIRWTEEKKSRHNLSVEKVYEVQDSHWIRQIAHAGKISTKNNGYRHLKIGFNKPGAFLDVVFKGRERVE